MDPKYVAPMPRSLFLNPIDDQEEEDDPGVLNLEDPDE